MKSVRVVAVDVGSVKSNFAWAGLDLPGRRPVGEGGGATGSEGGMNSSGGGCAATVHIRPRRAAG